MSSTRGGRPTVFTTDLGESILRLLAAGVPRKEVPGNIGISARTLAYWLARGRSGDPTYALFAEAFKRQLLANCQAGALGRLARSRAEASERWQRFKASREGWWLKHLGPREFWSRRLTWYAERDMTAEYNRTVASLEAQGYCITCTP